MTEFVVISVLNGVTYGMILFMVSAGLTLIFGMMGVVNFAHASFYMLGAYFAYALAPKLGFAAALVISPLLVAAVGVVMERLLLRPVSAHGHSHQILVTFGAVFIMRELVNMVFGRFSVPYRVPPGLQFTAFVVFGTAYPFYRIMVGGVSVAMFALLFAILYLSRVGIVVRAAVFRAAMVGALGHNVPLVFTGVFGVGAWLAGVAGALGGALFTTNPNLGLDLGGIVFVVVVVGGLGSLKGALLASLLIGLISTFAVSVDWSAGDAMALIGLGPLAGAIGGLLEVKLSSVAGALPYFLMLAVLVLRPAGLAGTKN